MIRHYEVVEIIVERLVIFPVCVGRFQENITGFQVVDSQWQIELLNPLPHLF